MTAALVASGCASPKAATVVPPVASTPGTSEALGTSTAQSESMPAPTAATTPDRRPSFGVGDGASWVTVHAVDASTVRRSTSPGLADWDCPCRTRETWGVAEVLCPKDVKTCTRSRAETTLQCGFTRYSCGAYLILERPGGGVPDQPLIDAVFDARSGRLVAVASSGGLAHRQEDGTWSDCFCDGPPTFRFPQIAKCEKSDVPCDAGR